MGGKSTKCQLGVSSCCSLTSRRQPSRDLHGIPEATGELSPHCSWLLGKHHGVCLPSSLFSLRVSQDALKSFGLYLWLSVDLLCQLRVTYPFGEGLVLLCVLSLRSASWPRFLFTSRDCCMVSC